MDEELKEKKIYEWRLTWSGYKDSPALRKSVEYLNVFPLFRDSKAHLITSEEYMDMYARGVIAQPRSYWQIGKNEVGLISLSAYTQYTSTWERINTAHTDYMAGYAECEKILKYERDWDAAHVEYKERKKEAKRLERERAMATTHYYT